MKSDKSVTRTIADKPLNTWIYDQSSNEREIPSIYSGILKTTLTVNIKITVDKNVMKNYSINFRNAGGETRNSQ